MKQQSVNVEDLAGRSRDASRELGIAGTRTKNRALEDLITALQDHRKEILRANEKDVQQGREDGLSDALIDRLRITPDRLSGMVDGIRDVIQLEDPVGQVLGMKKRPNGLKIGRQRVPLGVVGMIYESRPNVTVEAGVLCLKSGNAILLRGGSEARNSNYLLVDIMQEAIGEHLPETSVQILRDQDHDLVNELLHQDRYIDVVIPRGGERLIRTVAEQSTIPVIKHYKGVCHVYVSDAADLTMAHEICVNAKTQRTSVCNAMETLLVHEDLPASFLRDLFEALRQKNVELRVDETLMSRLGGEDLELQPVSEEDWTTEYLDSILSVRSVSSLDTAIDHVNTYGSNHSDSIVTEKYRESERFLNEVDSAAVYVNASTRFTDGHEFGLGAEIGISTDRIHARGPMGLKELTIPKYVIYGQGQVRN